MPRWRLQSYDHGRCEREMADSETKVKELTCHLDTPAKYSETTRISPAWSNRLL